MNLPDTVYLYYTSWGFTTLLTDGLKDHPDYTLLGSAPVDFGDVYFDETECKLRALNAKLGEAQHQVDSIKEEIQKLQAIGHDAPAVVYTSFDDDIPF